MDLESIKDPKFLRTYDTNKLEDLASTIRTFLIEKISKTGGHLGPNLGVVELTLVLHHLFESPKDKFIWDVGHQAYVHKILTGRASQFDTLKQYKGLCGFPKRSESAHDVWETGHSSTSLSAAMGMATARDLKGTDEDIVAVIGDGALTGGMALEALNHIGHEQKDLIVILNDNEMSIAPNVGALHNVLGRLRTAGKYKKVKEEFESLLKKVPAGGRMAATAERLKDCLKYLFVSGIFFEELGFTYLGPVDGHNIDDLTENIRYAKKTKGPVLVHVLTQKGKGYQPAETDAIGTWHGPGPYKIESGDFIKPSVTGPGYSKVVSETLRTIARKNERLVVLTPAMTVGSKLESFGEEFPDRLYDVGIAEQHATTMAAGLATQDMKPVLSIYSTFLQRAYDQLVHDVCRQNLNVVFAVDRSGLVGSDGETHQGVFDIAFLRHLPNMVVLNPKDENELQHMMHTAVQYDDGPIAVRFPRGTGLGVPMDKELHEIEIGSWEVLRQGKDIALIAVGTMIPVAEKAAERLNGSGINAKVINARSIKPLDHGMITELVTNRVPILTIEEGILQGGFGSAVLEFVHDLGIHNAMIDRMGIPDRFIEHGSVSKLLEEIDLTPEGVVERVKTMVPKQQQRAF
ncbi:1-deoxy-D-xylulose-5-phosphate synthase [Alkalihalobacillus sp. AL-G]|uniref:1-deoxy-D-xylulose-5-phosphate synthase n=1 Tax=Alkalihalobacillus sp. AL-G TaxID=2926399 RepID=UPI00272BB72C|nr:1-deoxy-D-xylulose-5-phosphate synthase [Alkalihalobacillus sp. AL-G]WLD91985.1 1-deoxy-D-xylulose-5-phosphate synthase [Alkalihalobacillus sp. AL-G]